MRLSCAFAAFTCAAARSINRVPLFDYETKHLEHTCLEYGRLLAFDTEGPTPLPRECKPGPGDAGWPSRVTWAALNRTLDGALIRTVPLAAPCYKSWGVYDAEKCHSVTVNWTKPALHDSDATSVMWPLWQGRSCLPTGSTCTLGAYPAYAVNATTVKQIQLAVNFARNLGLRIVVKNTGHDYQGRSSGAGALSIWTHNLQQLRHMPDFVLGGFAGQALHVGAGVQTRAIAEAAEEHGASVVGGMCASVGYAGGYFAGGGHSPLSGLFGLAADHVLAINVVTPDGRFTTATADRNADLYWALRGGGGGTFGVTTVHTTTLQLSFQTSAGVGDETFWQGVRAYFANFDRMTRAGIYAYTNLRRNSPLFQNASYSLALEPIVAPNISIESLTRVMEPVLDDLTKLGIPYKSSAKHFTSYNSAWADAWPPEQGQVAEPNSVDGSRLFPRGVWNDPAGFEASFKAIRGVVEAGYDITAFAMAPRNPFGADNAANPALRHCIAFFTTSILLPSSPTPKQLEAAQNTMLNDILSSWRQAAPFDKLGGSYANEGNVGEPNWQQDFYGDNYGRLLRIKRRWDPSGLFYVPAGVGSEAWEVRTEGQGIQTQNGPLCRRRTRHG
ncbi:hypothetical protein CP533_3265 [Ophiocordyceps camponoti-saundersi (nom. inval.)]|nr:hypothetical protein CP533_3265 [Ophiocordyceps camponoti-saundersi (nom. inval.)]